MEGKNEPGLSSELIKRYQQNFALNDKYQLAQNVCTTHPITDVCVNRNVKQNTQHCYNHKVETEGKPMTDQQQSGRCWIFACLNCMRLPVMKKFGLDELELSQTYLFFWDKVERANYLLDAFVRAAKGGETYDGRLINHLLTNPSEDGGQWDMLKNLIEKHGVVPKSCFPEAEQARRSGRLGRIINNRLREYCMRLHKMVSKAAADAELAKEKTEMMEEIYRILCICLGTPPSKFTFQYYSKGEDKKSEYRSIGPISPRDFYHQHIKPDCFDMEDMVCVVNDPRPQNPYNQLYTVDYLGNMTGGKPVLYINKPIQELKELAIKTISEHNKPVWFGCDVMQCFRLKDGFMDLNVLDYKLVFDADMLKMNKAERLMYKESLMTHAMTFTAVQTETDENGKTSGASKWRVENSWGDKDGDKGYLAMSDEWFTEFVYEVVVSKKLLDADTLALLETEPTVLPAWDPMGALAC